MRTRTARVTDTTSEGQFSMTLATEGEASDGDILSIRGGVVPDQMPLLISHMNHPTEVAGSITEPQKRLRDSPPRLRAVGTIDLEGEGAQADIRRDIHHMISQGHITGVSVRWDELEGGKRPVRRTDLPKDHPAHVRDDEPSQRKRFGFYWPEWRALEGSIVALGADSKALIGRAQETTGHVRAFWRAMAEEAEHDGAADLAAALSCLRVDAAECRSLGATAADLVNAAIDKGGDDLEPVELGGRTFFLPQGVADQLAETRQETVDALDLEPPHEREAAPEPEPEPEEIPDPVSPLTLDVEQVRKPLDANAIGKAMADAIEEHEARLTRNVKALMDLYTGKVTER